MKKAVVTTFPLDYYNICAREMLESFDRHWPADIELFIQLDCVPQEQFDAMQADLNTLLSSGREFYICNDWSEGQKEFYQRNTDSSSNYRFHVCKFSHKVFALKTAVEHARQTGIECLIWLDADVITHAPITHELLEKELLPIGDDALSYLGRADAPHSECGFMAFNCFSVIDEMHNYYINDKVLQLPGWTDCDVFDAVRQEIGIPGRNLSYGIDGWHVWPQSPLGKYMEHRKGNRKLNNGQKPAKLEKSDVGKVISAHDMQIKTKNCLPKERIQENIKENLTLIKHWVGYVKPNDEEVVICSAGSSLSYTDIKPYADRGVKIITVKHAIDRLKAWGIKPWACILLDPRPHVESFVKRPDPDVIYFVASMVDPLAVRALLDAGCHVVGYHAFVGAGENTILPKGALMVSGGSATATRCIGLLHECLGFSEFHCYGYDLCHFDRPDPNAKNDDGSPKFIEITLGALSWGGKTQNRFFWTEGQLLAQAKELHDLYKTKQSFKLHIHGYGLAAWQYSHWKQYAAWIDRQNERVDLVKNNSLSLSEWEYGITGRNARSKYDPKSYGFAAGDSAPA